MKKIKIEVQYFRGCPNSEAINNMVKEFVDKNREKLPLEFEEVLVETPEEAKKYKFRGSPTILINGKDIEGMEENENPSLSCRYYPNGLPSEKDLENFISALV